MKVPVGGGQPSVVAAGQGHPQGIVANGAQIYWSSSTSILSAAIAGGPVTTVAAGQAGPWGLAMGTGLLLWINQGTYSKSFHDGAVQGLQLSTAGLATLASAQYEPSAIAADAVNVYWADLGSGAILQAPLGSTGSGATTLVAGPAAGAPRAIAVDATSVYWTNSKSNGAIMSVPIGGGPVTTLASGQSYPYGVAVDGTSVYWTNSGTGKVIAMALPNGAPQEIASGQSTPEGIAVDTNNVYWITHGTATTNGTVMRANKP
jgi:hypothetical protein